READGGDLGPGRDRRRRGTMATRNSGEAGPPSAPAGQRRGRAGGGSRSGHRARHRPGSAACLDSFLGTGVERLSEYVTTETFVFVADQTSSEGRVSGAGSGDGAVAPSRLEVTPDGAAQVQGLPPAKPPGYFEGESLTRRKLFTGGAIAAGGIA